MTPAVTAALAKKGFQIRVEKGAGLNAKFRDSEYAASGAKISDQNAVYQAGMNAQFLVYIFLYLHFLLCVIFRYRSKSTSAIRNRSELV